MSLRIDPKITVKGGRWLRPKYASLIIARSLVPTDRNGNMLRKRANEQFYWDMSGRQTEPYYRTWRIRKEKDGFIFREISSGSGINSHHKTVRDLVISVAMFFEQIAVTIETEISVSCDTPQETTTKAA